MPCLVCTPTKPIIKCTTNLILGIIAETSADIWIHVRNITTGKLYRQSATSSGAGVVTLDKTKPSTYFYSPNHAFELWVTLEESTFVESITIGAEEVTCLNPVFENPTDDDNLNISQTTQTVALDV
jgi:hypothetical protein